MEAKGLSLPPGTPLPPAIQAALAAQPHTLVGSPTTAHMGSRNRDSMLRKKAAHLPYVVLEFDKNEVLIHALGGSLETPLYSFTTHL